MAGGKGPAQDWRPEAAAGEPRSRVGGRGPLLKAGGPGAKAQHRLVLWVQGNCKSKGGNLSYIQKKAFKGETDFMERAIAVLIDPEQVFNPLRPSV